MFEVLHWFASGYWLLDIPVSWQNLQKYCNILLSYQNDHITSYLPKRNRALENTHCLFKKTVYMTLDQVSSVWSPAPTCCTITRPSSYILIYCKHLQTVFYSFACWMERFVVILHGPVSRNEQCFAEGHAKHPGITFVCLEMRKTLHLLFCFTPQG